MLVLVSGGADSACLLDVLARLHDGPLHVLTFDHGLRPEAGRECGVAERNAAERGIPASRVELGLEPGPGMQARARTARLEAAEAIARARSCMAVATGHTASDQAETVLFRMARGAGRTGALGIAPRRGALIRPLLPLMRAETRAWCAAHGIAYADDPSNEDPAAARTRVRAGLLPAMRAVHPAAERNVANLAESLADEAELLEEVVDAAWSRAADVGGLDASSVAGAPPALGRLLIRRLLHGAGLRGDALARAAVEAVLVVATSDDGAAVTLSGGSVRRESGRLVARRARPAPRPTPLDVPGAARFGYARLRARVAPAMSPSPDMVALRPSGPLTVRGPRPGDRLALESGGHTAVGRLLAGDGVPACDRELVPVVAEGERVLWVAGHRADPAALAPVGARAVVLEVERT